MRESTIVARITKWLRSEGAFVVKIHGSNLQLDGLPDLMGTFRGRSIGIEVKVPGEDASDLQLWVLKQMAAAGALTGVVHSLEEAKQLCMVQPIYGFVVTNDRLDKAVAAIRTARTKMTTDQAIEVITQIGYADALVYEDGGSLQLRMSNLQLVVTAAALAAVAEAGMKQESVGD